MIDLLLLDAIVLLHPYLFDNTCLLYLSLRCVTPCLNAVHVHMYSVVVIAEIRLGADAV